MAEDIRWQQRFSNYRKDLDWSAWRISWNLRR